MDDDAHRVHLVAELLDDERSLVRHDSRRDALLMHVIDERRRCRFIGLIMRGERCDLLGSPNGVELATQFADP